MLKYPRETGLAVKVIFLGFIGAAITFLAIQAVGAITLVILLMWIIALGILAWVIYQTLYKSETTPSPPIYMPAVSEVCGAAMRRVNYEPGLTYHYRLTDIGLLAYRDQRDQSPTLIRSTPIPKECRYLRPFVKIEPGITAKRAKVTLQICEERAAVLYQYERPFTRTRKNQGLFLPPTWLDVRTAESDLNDKHWSVRLKINDQLIALHMVTWSKLDTVQMAAERRLDGEISPDLRRLMAKEQALTSVSLDELLSEQNRHNH